MTTRIGVIGGSGLYEMEGLLDVREERVETPFGDPSDAFVIGRLPVADGDVELVFLPRHGRGHRYTPTEVPYRANIYGMKALGVGWIVSVSAVGSLQEEIVPGHVVVIDQFIDRTRHRADSFFGEGIVAHVGFGDPVCPALRQMILDAAREVGATAHDGGTYICMEGPQFSTRAESHLYRSWGGAVIGMTNLTEAKLAREAEISYATLALSTDYDCWHPEQAAVTVDQVIAVLSANVELARRVVRAVAPKIAAFAGEPPMSNALRHAIMTHPSRVPPERRKALDLLVRKYLD
jgi:5'-methylthioadenosine phosphorylase